MDGSGIGESFEQVLLMVLVFAPLGLTWLAFTFRYMMQDCLLCREKRLKRAELRTILFWLYWSAGLVFLPSVVGLPFVIASIGMRGMRRWGWPLAAASHAILFVQILRLMFTQPQREAASRWVWSVGVGAQRFKFPPPSFETPFYSSWGVNLGILIVQLAGIGACIALFRHHSSWRARVVSSAPRQV
jgi:hypothetical protein